MAKIKKVPDGCIFCGGRPLTKEHFWPDWSAPYMPPSKDHTRGLTRGWVNAPDEVGRRSWQRQGHVGVITLPVVCDRCNNGWMSRLEEAVRPIIEPIMQNPRYATVITRESQKVLAVYFTMKVMVANHSILEHAIFSPSELTAMFEHKVIPCDITIDIHDYRGNNRNVMRYNREYALFREKGKSLWETTSRANYTFRFGSMFVRVFHLRGDGGLPPRDDMYSMHIRLHPPPNWSRAWPLPIQLSEMEALAYQHAFQIEANPGCRVQDLVRRKPAKPAAPDDRR